MAITFGKREKGQAALFRPSVYFFITIYFASIFIASVSVSPQSLEEKKEINFVLKNGLKGLLINRPGSPLINLVLAVGFGSRDESPSLSGMAHFLEHVLLFRGNRSKAVEEIYKELKKIGARVNGHTGPDATLFELSVPSEALEEGLRNFIDLLFNLNLDETDLAQEKEIILEEMNLQATEPLPLAVSLVYENLFPGHPYGHPVIGTRETLNKLTVENVMQTYRDYYSPANCALALVGDFQAGKTEELVKKYFGELEREKKERPPVAPPSPLEKVMRVERELDEQQSHLVVACRAPDISSPDQYAFDLMTSILGRGLNPLLAMALGARRIPIANISISYNSYRFSGVLLIYLIVDPKNVNQAEREIIRFLRLAHQENFSPDDVLGEAKDYVFNYLQSSRNLVKLNAERALEDGLALASSVASYLLLLEELNLPPYLETIERLNSSDLRKVASKYLSRPEVAVVVINPLKKSEKKTKTGSFGD